MTIKVQTFDGDRSMLRSNFELADDSIRQVAQYIGRGEVLVASDEISGDIIGHLQLVETESSDAMEIKNMAVIEARRGEGLGRALVEEALSRCRAKNATRLIVATAAADIGNLRFYQRLGFRMLHVVRDAFSPAAGYPNGTLIDGIVLRDQIVLDLLLEATDHR